MTGPVVERRPGNQAFRWNLAEIGVIPRNGLARLRIVAARSKVPFPGLPKPTPGRRVIRRNWERRKARSRRPPGPDAVLPRPVLWPGAYLQHPKESAPARRKGKSE